VCVSAIVLLRSDLMALAAQAGDPGGPVVPNGPVADFVDANAPVATPGDTLHEVALRIGAYDQPVAVIPAFDRRDGHYLGALERTMLLRAYSGEALRPGEEPTHRA
jgi:hypothetical protein